MLIKTKNRTPQATLFGGGLRRSVSLGSENSAKSNYSVSCLRRQRKIEVKSTPDLIYPEKTLKFYGMIQKNRTNRVVAKAVGPQYDNAMESTVRPAREHSGTGR